MSPEAVTAERVYADLKGAVMSGRHPPGAMLNIHDLAERVGTSITPVRDALQRLVGERLVRLGHGGGFQVALMGEAGLRDLYLWHKRLLRDAVSGDGTFRNAVTLARMMGFPDADDPALLASAAAEFFAGLGERSGSAEHVHAIRSAGDRLHAARIHEAGVSKPVEELRALWVLAHSGNPALLRQALSTYHRRRIQNVGKTIARMALLS